MLLLLQPLQLAHHNDLHASNRKWSLLSRSSFPVSLALFFRYLAPSRSPALAGSMYRLPFVEHRGHMPNAFENDNISSHVYPSQQPYLLNCLWCPQPGYTRTLLLARCVFFRLRNDSCQLVLCLKDEREGEPEFDMSRSCFFCTETRSHTSASPWKM